MVRGGPPSAGGRALAMNDVRALAEPLEHNAVFPLLQSAFSRVPVKSLPPAMKEPNTSFDIELPALPQQNQGSSGRCWIFAGVNVLRRRMMTKYNLKPEFNLSHAYLYFYAWLEKCNAMLETYAYLLDRDLLPSALHTCIQQNMLTDGGTWNTFAEVLQKYGCVPAEAYPDSRQAQSSAELVSMLKSLLTSTAAEMLQRRSAPPRSGSRGSLTAIKQQSMARVYRTLCSVLGTPPTAFRYAPGAHGPSTTKGRTSTLTPQAYYNDVVKHSFAPDDYVCLVSDPRRPFRESFGTAFTYAVLKDDDNDKVDMADVVSSVFYNLPMADIRAITRRTLATGTPLWFSCDVRKYFNEPSKMMNVRGSNEPLLIGDAAWTVPKEFLFDAGAVNNAHAMTLVGCNRTGDAYKVENSWGQEKDIRMSGDWFDRFVVTVCVPKSALPKGLRNALEKKPKPTQPVVPVWDIYSAPQV